MDLRELVRKQMQAGVLPTEPCDRVWAGPGTDKLCTGCGLPTKPTGTEFECDDERVETVVIFCRPCFFIWQSEVGQAEA
jgi:hypothetical protein